MTLMEALWTTNPLIEAVGKAERGEALTEEEQADIAEILEAVKKDDRGEALTKEEAEMVHFYFWASGRALKILFFDRLNEGSPGWEAFEKKAKREGFEIDEKLSKTENFKKYLNELPAEEEA